MKGKKTAPEVIYQVMISYAVTHSYAETARNLDMPETTVSKIVKDNINEPEFVELCAEKKQDFIETANRIIDKATELLERRLETALNDQDALQDIIAEIYADTEMKDQQKRSVATKVAKMQLNNLSEITTAIGTLYDKRALAKGDPTSNESVTIKVELTDE